MSDLISLLTASDLRLIRSLLNGHTSCKDIAWDIGRSVGGTKIRIGNIYKKLELNGLVDLALWAARHESSIGSGGPDIT